MFGFVVPAVFLAAIYFPTMTRLSRALVSPYPKADLRKRLLAASIDGGVASASAILYWNADSIALLVFGAVYVLLRDAIRGQSPGKLVAGLVVIDVETGQPCTLSGSIWRNAVFLIPGANVVAAVLETVTAVRDPQGQRLGDRIAQTQVVEGFGVRDLAAAFQQWWRSFLSELGYDSARGRRARAEKS